MKVRDLETKDAEYMLEWMHDNDVVQNLDKDFGKMTLENCVDFIKQSKKFEKELHLAVTDENDNYMGTVSLKNIDSENAMAEFAIVIRKCAMGKGYAGFAMQKILERGFQNYRLKKIYWYVAKENERAIHFYDKNHYQRVHYEDIQIEKPYGKERYIWYVAIS